MTRQSKTYLKSGIGAVIILAKFASPGPLFWPLVNAEAYGYDAASIGFLVIGLGLIISGILDIRKGTTK